jgi:spore maturation protein CgeB
VRAIAIHPGSSVSTVDVFRGMTKALRKQGHTVYEYDLDGRIDRSAQYLKWAWRKAGKPETRPTAADTLYHAGLPMLDMVLTVKPDVVLIFSGMFLLQRFMYHLRTIGVPVVLVLSESPYDEEKEAEWAKLASVVFTNERTSVPVLRAANPNTHYLPHAYDPDIHYPAPPDPSAPQHDVVFVGSLFKERVELLSAVNWDGIDFGLYGSTEMLSSRSKLRKYVRGGYVDNTMAVKLYRNAKIGLNLYRQSKGFAKDAPRIEHAESLNPRAYELAACGTFQISDHREEVFELFNVTVQTFWSADQLNGLIHDLLAAPVWVAGAAADQCRRVQGHTFDARAKQLVEVLQGAAAVAA